MAFGNTLGDLFRVTTFGESHGTLVGVVVEGCPAGLKLDTEAIQHDLDRRKPGQSDINSQRKESDLVSIKSGVYQGFTTGRPICMLVANDDVDSSKYKNIVDKFRDGHADFNLFMKYDGFNDPNGGGGSSARLTVGDVAAGAIGKQILREIAGVKIVAYTANVGGVEATKVDFDYIEKNKLRCPDPTVFDAMNQKVLEAMAENDSIGGAVQVLAGNVPIGLGSPNGDKLNAAIMHSLGGLNAVKAVSIGYGPRVESMRGSEYNDAMDVVDGNYVFKTNHAGGIIGGISNGEIISARLSVKPTPTRKGVPMKLATREGTVEEVIIKGRHDPVIMPRLVSVAGARMAIVLTDALFKETTSTMSSLKRVFGDSQGDAFSGYSLLG